MQLFSSKQKKIEALNWQLADEAKQLKKKMLIPKHTLSFFTPENIKKAAIESFNDTIKEFQCPHCNVKLHNRMMFRQHLKIHSNKARDSEKLKADEGHKSDAKVYF